MRVTVVGSGYVGLVVGCCLAEFGNDVRCVDNDETKIEALRRGRVPFFEPNLQDLLDRNMAAGRLSFTMDLAESVRFAQIVFIAVGTPPDEDGSADLTHVLDVARGIGRAMDSDGKLVCIKSTVPVGTADEVRDTICALTDHSFTVVSNPEFLKEGDAVNDFLKPDRVIIGTEDDRAREIMADLYAPYMRTQTRILFMDNRSAEMTKYVANALLASRISFMNEIANLCELVGADVTDVRHGVGADHRIGPQFLFPGVGYGGSCFPKDVDALSRTAREHGMELSIVEAVARVNRRQKRVLLEKIRARFGDDLSGVVVGVWGLSFKPGTDDMREAPSITLIEGLLEAGATVRAHDPAAGARARALFGDRVEIMDHAYEVCEGADCLAVVTEWRQYRNPDFEKIRDLMRRPVVFDGRNLYRTGMLAGLGFEHYPIGRPGTGSPSAR